MIFHDLSTQYGDSEDVFRRTLPLLSVFGKYNDRLSGACLEAGTQWWRLIASLPISVSDFGGFSND